MILNLYIITSIHLIWDHIKFEKNEWKKKWEKKKEKYKRRILFYYGELLSKDKFENTNY